jgi:hypothetical protein
MDEISYRTCNLFNGHVRIDAMLIEEVDRFDAEPLQRAFYSLPDVVGPAAQTLRLGVRLRTKVEAKLGCDHDAVSQRGKRLTHEFLVHKRAVHLRRVEEGDAPFYRVSYQSNHLLFGPAHFSVASAHAHASQPDSRDLEPACS